MKPFNLKEAKAGKPVCTRDGRDVRLICWDKQSTFPIVGLVGKEEEICTFQISGKYIDTLENYDLMMKEEPTLDDYTTIKTYEDACKALGIELIYNSLQIVLPKHIIALMKLETISRALRGNWKPVKEETVFVPKLIDGEIIAGVRSYHKYTTDSHFTQQTSEKAKYFGKQFIDLWKEYLMGE